MTLRGALPMESQPVAENARLPSYELRREPFVRAVSGISKPVSTSGRGFMSGMREILSPQ